MAVVAGINQASQQVIACANQMEVRGQTLQMRSAELATAGNTEAVSDSAKLVTQEILEIRANYSGLETQMAGL